MAETKGKLKLNNLHNLTLKVEVSKVLTLRLRMFQLLMRFACWVGSVGVDFVDFEPPNNRVQSDVDYCRCQLSFDELAVDFENKCLGCGHPRR